MTSLAMIAARRGDSDVWPHLDAAMTAADGSTGEEYIGPVRLARAEVRWLESDLTAARQEAELADDAFAHATDPWHNGEIAVWLRRTGSPRAGQRALAGPYRLQLTGDYLVGTGQARSIEANRGRRRREAGCGNSDVGEPHRATSRTRPPGYREQNGSGGRPFDRQSLFQRDGTFDRSRA
jgi:hypothetical protein